MSNPGYEASEEFGLLYDEVPAYTARGDIDFYVAEAARVAPDGAAVLELGCGTGRITLPLARAGHEVTGIDQSATMLARCRAKLALETQAVRARVSLQHADVRDLDLRYASDTHAGQSLQFPLVLAPFRVMQHLVSTSDQLRCLAAVKRHLARGGRFAFDVFNPHYALMSTDRSKESEDTPERRITDGRFLRRAFRVSRVRFVDQVSEVELIYYLRNGADTQRIVQAFEMRWYTPPELEHLLARAGFAIASMYGDFDRTPLADGAPEIVVVARLT